MCDADMDTGSDFDIGSETDVGSDTNTEIGSNLESLDSVEDVSADIFSDGSDGSDLKSLDTDLDFADDFFEDDDVPLSFESNASETLEDLPDVSSYEEIDAASDSEPLGELDDIEVFDLLESEPDSHEESYELGSQEIANGNDDELQSLYSEAEVLETMNESETGNPINLDNLDSGFIENLDTFLQSHELPQGWNDEAPIDFEERLTDDDMMHELSEPSQPEAINEASFETQIADNSEIIPNNLLDGSSEPINQFDSLPSDEIEEENEVENINISEGVMQDMNQQFDGIEGTHEITENISHESNELESLSLDELDAIETEDETSSIDHLEATEISQEGNQRALDDIQAERDRLTELRDDLLDLQAHLSEETDEDPNGGTPLVRTLEVTPEIQESRDRDTEAVLDNYRDNLREYGVNEAAIEEYITQEREKINAEYESLDRGDEYPEMYVTPNDWESVASSLMNPDIHGEIETDLSQEHSETVEQLEPITNETQELDINYEEIYEGIQQEALEQGFEDIQIDTDPEALNESLQNFTETNWAELSLNEQKESMSSLADYVVDVIGFNDPPQIEYYNNPQEGDFGGYDSSTNTLHVNEYMLYNSSEAADTIAHELWHAHQHECAVNPQCARDYQYQYNFDNYIPPELGQEAYEAQLVEAEARAFAAQFKDRLALLGGRSR